MFRERRFRHRCFLVGVHPTRLSCGNRASRENRPETQKSRAIPKVAPGPDAHGIDAGHHVPAGLTTGIMAQCYVRFLTIVCSVEIALLPRSQRDTKWESIEIIHIRELLCFEVAPG